MHYVFVDVLQAIVAHPSDKEPTANIFVLFYCLWVLTLSPTVYINASKVAWKFSLVFGNQSPFREFFSFISLDEQSANFVSAEFKPEHVVCEVEIQVVLV